MKKYLITISTISFLLLLLTFPSISLNGAKNGLMLWFQTVLPTLLPFMIVSNLIVQLGVTDCLTSFFYPVAGRLFGLSKPACYPFIIGMLSGYPVGAKACADLVKEHQITRNEGQFLLCFCNNASPMFIISFVAAQCLSRSISGPWLLGIVYGSGLLSGFVYRILEGRRELSSGYNPPLSVTSVSSQRKPELSPFIILDNTILNAFVILVKVGGYIILFSILAEIILHLTAIPALARYFTIGFLEITTGASAIGFASFSTAQKIALTTALTAFGGLSSHAQTLSVIMNSGLSIKKYFIYKCINASIAGIIALLLVNIF